MSAASGGRTRRLILDRPAALGPTFALLRRGAGDPTHRRLGGTHLRATRTPEGPVLLKVVSHGTEVAARAWGDGATWALDQLPRLVGETDDPAGFVPAHPLLVEAQHRFGHYRVGRTDAVLEALAPACLEQVVTGKEAFRAWRALVTEFGEPAPGPANDAHSAAYGMRLPPSPAAWARGTELAVPGRRGGAAAQRHPGRRGHPGDGPGAHPGGSSERRGPGFAQPARGGSLDLG